MDTYSTALYFVILIVALGIGLALFFRFYNADSELESRITGIWANESNTMRILIYSMESKFQAEVVWTRNVDESILGSGIIRNLRLNYLSQGEGTYICPFTKNQMNFRLKLKQSGLLHLHLFGKSRLAADKVEAWKLVK